MLIYITLIMFHFDLSQYLLGGPLWVIIDVGNEQLGKVPRTKKCPRMFALR